MSTDEHPSGQSLDEQKSLSPTRSDVTPDKRDAQNPPERHEGASAQVSRTMMERFSAMMQFTPGRDPLVEKMTPEHVTAVIANKDKDGEREHTEEMARITSHRMYYAGGVVFVLALCWLFLSFGKTEHLDAVLAAIAGLAGGFGLGKASHDEKHDS